MKRWIYAGATGAAAALFASGCMLGAETTLPDTASPKAGQAELLVSAVPLIGIGDDLCFSGDVDCNGAVNFFDVDPFMDAMLLGAAPCSMCAADTSCDGAVDERDIDSFMAALFDQRVAQTPCIPPVTLCPDGGLRVRAPLGTTAAATGATEAAPASLAGDAGEVDYRDLPGGCKRFRVRVDGLLASGAHDVIVGGVTVSALRVDAQGRGALELNTRDGTFPASFPSIRSAEIVRVGTLSGAFVPDCASASDNCNAAEPGLGVGFAEEVPSDIGDNGVGSANNDISSVDGAEEVPSEIDGTGAGSPNNDISSVDGAEAVPSEITGADEGSLGDLNCDGEILPSDINPFLLALLNPAAYAIAHPGCPMARADLNRDNAVNFFDVDPFLARLVGASR